MNPEILDVKDCLVLIALRRVSSISRVASELGISQPAVSQRILLMEERLGCCLVHRGQGRSRVSLTAKGLQAEDVARRVISMLGSLSDELNGAVGVISGKVHVATVYSLGLHSLAGPIRQYLEDVPSAELDIEYMRTDRVYESVLSGESDVGVVACAKDQRGLTIIPWIREPMVLVASPNFRSSLTGPFNLVDLQHIPYIAFSEGIPTRALVDDVLRRAGVHVDIRKNYDNIETLKRTIELGFGVSFLPKTTVLRELRDGVLCEWKIDTLEFMRPCGVLLPEGKPLSRATLAWIRILCPSTDVSAT